MDVKNISERIQQVVHRETGLTDGLASDVAFHMTDWLDDLARFDRFCAEPDKWNDKDVEEMLFDFLTHVPNHVAAAAKLLTGIPVTDVFEVGALENETGGS